MSPASFQDPFHDQEGVYHFSMDHLPQGLLFRTDDDFRYGRNSLAAATLKFPVRICAYCLMDNHFHLLIKSRLADAKRLMEWYLMRLIVMLSRKYGVRGLIKMDAYDIQAITDRRMFQNILIYIIRNPYKARLCSPLSYLWSSADVYFNPQLHHIKGTSCGHPGQAQKSFFHTHDRLPAEWEHIDGCIVNRYFVDYRLAEKYFNDSYEFFSRLRIFDLESAVAQAQGKERLIAFTDQELQEKIFHLCRYEYHVESIHQLDTKSLFHLALSLSQRFRATPKQISRLLSIPPDTLDRLL